MTNVTFIDNVALVKGGGWYIKEYPHNVKKVTFKGNRAPKGRDYYYNPCDYYLADTLDLGEVFKKVS